MRARSRASASPACTSSSPSAILTGWLNGALPFPEPYNRPLVVDTSVVSQRANPRVAACAAAEGHAAAGAYAIKQAGVQGGGLDTGRLPRRWRRAGTCTSWWWRCWATGSPMRRRCICAVALGAVAFVVGWLCCGLN